MSADTQVESDEAEQEPKRASVLVTLAPGNIWRVGMVAIAVVAVGLFFGFILDDGGSVIFTVLMAWFASIAMEPAVVRLSKHMKRGLAAMVVMLSVFAFMAAFFAMFGKLLVEQIVEIVKAIPELIDSTLAWINETFDMRLKLADILETFDLDNERIAELATEVGGNALGILGSFLGSVFSIFTLGLFVFYLSADGPRLRLWIAKLFPQRVQPVVVNVWDITAQKTGGYVSARVILAALNAGSTAIVFYVIGMPYWLALALWTGLVAQFVPTIGTYIAIILPVLIGLLSDDPMIGVYALIWGVVYQQIENLTFEPKISAKAVDVNPAVAFGSVLMGAALFGVAGAILAVPVTAMLLSLLSIYGDNHSLAPGIAESDPSGSLDALGDPEVPPDADTPDKGDEAAPATT
jgi:predicted PurR-regulated permease PerM